MALTFAGSFDWITTNSGGDTTKRGYSLGGTTAAMTRETGRISGYSLQFDCATGRLHTCGKALPAAYAEGFFAFALQINTGFSTSGAGDILRLNNSTTVQLALQLDSTGKLSVLRGGTSLGQTAAAVLSLGTWHRVELYFLIHDTTGAFELRVDGVNVLSASGVDTRNGTPTTVDNFVFSHPLRTVGNDAMRIDDLTFNDTTGGTNTGFLGDLHIETLRPGADSLTGWTPSAGSDHFATVDDATGLDLTDYISAASTAEDRFALGNLAASPTTIFAVQTLFHGSKDDAGACNVRARAVSAPDIGNGTAHAMTTGGAIHTDLFELDPQGGAAWTGSRVNAAQLGIERTA